MLWELQGKTEIEIQPSPELCIMGFTEDLCDLTEGCSEASPAETLTAISTTRADEGYFFPSVAADKGCSTNICCRPHHKSIHGHNATEKVILLFMAQH